LSDVESARQHLDSAISQLELILRALRGEPSEKEASEIMPSYFVKVRVTSTDRKAAQAAAVRIARLFPVGPTAGF